MAVGVVRLGETGLHSVKCLGCVKVNWYKNICQVITNPREEWERGRCRYRSEDPRWKRSAEIACTQYQQSRWPGPWDEDPLGWLMDTKPPSIRDKEPILHLPAPPAGKSSSRSRKKRKKRPPLMTDRYRLL